LLFALVCLPGALLAEEPDEVAAERSEAAALAKVLSEIPLPPLPDTWHKDPLQHVQGQADRRLKAEGENRWRLGPVESHGKEWFLVIPKAGSQAELWVSNQHVSMPGIQRLFRRVLVGPITTSQLGPDGTDTDYMWVVIRQGRVHTVRQIGEPRYFDDELSVDIVLDNIILSELTAPDRERWRRAWWDRERRLWEQAARHAPPAR
jgi:hypothetical protein